MSQALSVSERALLACGQIFFTLTTTTVLQGRVAARSHISFVSFVPQWHKGFNVSPRDTWVLHHLNLIVSQRDTWVLHPPISLCSTGTQCIVSHRYMPVQRLHCEVQVVSHCQFISVNSSKYSTIDCSEQC